MNDAIIKMDRKRTRPVATAAVSSSSSSSSCSSPKEALEILYHRLGGTNWTRQENWLSKDVPLSQWSGVTTATITTTNGTTTTDGPAGTSASSAAASDATDVPPPPPSTTTTTTTNTTVVITALELSQNNLIGQLDDKDVISALLLLGPTIEQLWLSENSLRGNLPSILANRIQFPKLSILDVGSNQFIGSLHPNFSTIQCMKHFSWFDITGNQLTSYFRYTTKDEIYNNNKDNTTTTMIVNGIHNCNCPLPNVYVVPSILTPTVCQELIDLAVEYTTTGGWQLNRHKKYPTTDIDIAQVGGRLWNLCNTQLQTILLPTISQLFTLPVYDLAVEDLFLAKYSAEKDEQRSLMEHCDDSELSFVITLNDTFEGGGTQFLSSTTTTTTTTASSSSSAGATTTSDDKKDNVDNRTAAAVVVAPKTVGTGVFFCGHRRHAGVEVVQGTRYILAGFVRVYPSNPMAVSKLQELLDQV